MLWKTVPKFIEGTFANDRCFSCLGCFQHLLHHQHWNPATVPFIVTFPPQFHLNCLFLPWKSSWKIKHKSTIFSLKKVFVAIQCVHQRRQMAVPFFTVLLWSLDVALLMLNHGQDALYFWEIKESHAKLQRRQRELRIPLVRDPKSRYCFVVNQVRLTNKGKPCKTPEAAECTLHLKDPLTLTKLPGK